MANRTEKLLTEKQAAEMLAVHYTTLSTWRCKRRYSLPFVRLGSARAIRYRLSDVLAFIDSGLVKDSEGAA
jgi:hypothetical protein